MRPLGLQFASVFACSDCTVVIGAVGRMVRLERCERVQLICAAARIIISSCHDCILHLAVNRAPLLIGDNRFLQVRHPETFHCSSIRLLLFAAMAANMAAVVLAVRAMQSEHLQHCTSILLVL